MNYRSFESALLFLAIAAGVPYGASAETPAPTAAEIERQIASLQEQLNAARIAEAKASLAAEEAAVKALEEARRKAAEGRAVLADLGEPQPQAPPPSTEGTVQTTTTKPDGTQIVEVKPYSPEGLRDNENGKQKFGGIEFGVGIAFSYDLGKHDRIREAELVNGVVRVTQSDNVRARLILESHYFFTPDGTGPFLPALFGLENKAGDTKKSWGWGPFIAIQPGSDNIIDAVGAGLMVGLRRPGEGSDSFNIGLGVLYDLDTQILGDDVVENMPLPLGETTIRFKKREQSGLLLMSSYSF